MIVVLWLAAGVLLFVRTVARDLNHDEHQFIAPGALLAREGLLPYRDYPLFHLPNLVLAYAAMDRLTGDPILGPKLVSFASTWLSAGLILLTCLPKLGEDDVRLILMAASLLALLLFDPLLLYTAGKTWNHEAPSFLLLLAVVFHVAAGRYDSLLYVVASGAACGLAVGTRLTFLPCFVPLAALFFWSPMKAQRRWQMAGSFSVAALISLAPSLYFFASARDAFLFGNLEFPRLRLLDPENLRIQKTTSVWRKLRFLVKEVLLPSWPLFLAFGAAIIPGIRHRLGVTAASRSGTPTILWVSAFLVVGCFLPSRYQYQHFFALVPLAILGIAFAVSSVAHRSNLPVGGLVALALISAVLTFLRPPKGAPAFPDWRIVAHRDQWFSTEAADFGTELRQHAPARPILTLAPAWPIAAGLPIYSAFATGPFAWRSARFVAPERRAAFHIVGPDDLPGLLDLQPPAGILTGVEEDELEAPLIAYAKAHGFTAAKLTRKRLLWVR